ncbi:cobalamin B12-binding domain-containing protein [Acetobacterium bakii]|uniref:Cobalamin-binding protein n=1 Tax=Acetobacterium bakii TaxID=52689 RepID=A0A0L6TYI0_9FIRM|nr:cobalamin-dependent protein [Acetobacterium bakii]KNZ40625.1 cobalamin-binding protein [Acetobacterium bakii]
MKQSIVRSIEGLYEDRTLELVRIAIRKGFKPIEIFKWLQIGMERVGKLYETSDYFIADLIFAGIIFQEVMELDELEAITKVTPKNKIGKLLLFSVFGDCHDIGKNIFGSFARTAGFEIIDLGTNVSLNEVMNALERIKPDIIGLSGMQQETVYEMRAIVCEMISRGIRDDYRIIIGGAVINDKTEQIVGADYATKDVTKGVEKCKTWMQEKTSQKNNSK